MKTQTNNQTLLTYKSKQHITDALLLLLLAILIATISSNIMLPGTSQL